MAGKIAMSVWQRQLVYAIANGSPQIHAQCVDQQLVQQWDVCARDDKVKTWLRASICWVAKQRHGVNACYWRDDVGITERRFEQLAAVFERHFSDYINVVMELLEPDARNPQWQANLKIERLAAAETTAFEQLTVEHHIEVLPLPTVAAMGLLAQASEGGWTIQKLRAERRRIESRPNPKPVIPAAILRTIAHPKHAAAYFEAFAEAAAEAGQIDLLYAAVTAVEERVHEREPVGAE